MAKILIIDDDRLICSCLSAAAEAEGHEARAALEGRSGSDVAQSFQPDLVFVDLLMPGRAGLETLVALRKELPSARLIAMTGQPMVGQVSLLDLARKFGADSVLEKPFSVTDIAGLIHSSLPA
jgi:DNA-binding response OmpR family regulator